MLDHHYSIAVVTQAVQDSQQLANIFEVQPGSGLVEDIQRLAGVALGQLSGQLDALGLTAGQGNGTLTQADIGKPHVEQGLQAASDGRYRTEELQRVFDGHLQHFVDALALVLDLQGFTVITLALAHVTRHINVRQEVHLHLDHAFALAGFAASALDVEAEAAGLVTA